MAKDDCNVIKFKIKEVNMVDYEKYIGKHVMVEKKRQYVCWRDD